MAIPPRRTIHLARERFRRKLDLMVQSFFEQLRYLRRAVSEIGPAILWLSPWQEHGHGGRTRFVIARVPA
jgi:hypothetical protein